MVSSAFLLSCCRSLCNGLGCGGDHCNSRHCHSRRHCNSRHCNSRPCDLELFVTFPLPLHHHVSAPSPQAFRTSLLIYESKMLVKTALQGVLQFAIPGVTVYSRSSLQASKSVRRRLALSATRKFSSDKSR